MPPQPFSATETLALTTGGGDPKDWRIYVVVGSLDAWQVQVDIVDFLTGEILDCVGFVGHLDGRAVYPRGQVVAYLREERGRVGAMGLGEMFTPREKREIRSGSRSTS